MQLEQAASRAAGSAAHWDLEQLVSEVSNRLASSQAKAAETPTSSAPALKAAAEGLVDTDQKGMDLAPILAEELRLREAESPPKAPTAASDPADEYVLVENLATRVWHRTSYTLRCGRLQNAAALCGWKFGMTNRQSRLAPWSDLPDDPFRMCSRCLPTQRKEALKSLALHVTGKMES